MCKEKRGRNEEYLDLITKDIKNKKSNSPKRKLGPKKAKIPKKTSPRKATNDEETNAGNTRKNGTREEDEIETKDITLNRKSRSKPKIKCNHGDPLYYEEETDK